MCNSRRLGRYLSFFHALNVKIFNVGDYRRRRFGASQNAEWFDMQNAEARRMREEVNNEALTDMLQFFRESSTNSVGILDATNSTRVHRASILQKVVVSPRTTVLSLSKTFFFSFPFSLPLLPLTPLTSLCAAACCLLLSPPSCGTRASTRYSWRW